ncbi:MAG: hypothetical protein WAK04_13745 [Xanthobacteraceae bacterium]
MGTIVTRKRYYAALLSIVLAGFAGAASADDLPSYMAPIGGRTASSAAETATKDVLALNTMMFQLYGASGAIFRKNLLDNHPIILGLFTGAGGRFILYRPGQSPLEAPPVPIKYQLMKSVGHSTMALSEVVMPFLDNASDTSWRGSLLAYRSQMQSALDDLNKADVLGDWQENSKLILANNIAFMDDCAKNGVITVAAFQAFAKKQAPLLKKNIAWAAQTQIGHWMGVIADWKKMLGSDWDKTYAASNAIYVARQNNMLFSVLAQFFGPDAINSRLVLIETISFTTTPEEMLDALTRIVADRSVGAAFFGSYYLMDYELMGGDGRAAIIDESKKRGMTPFLPPAVAFGSHQWPTLITPGSGPASLADLP